MLTINKIDLFCLKFIPSIGFGTSPFFMFHEPELKGNDLEDVCYQSSLLEQITASLNVTIYIQ